MSARIPDRALCEILDRAHFGYIETKAIRSECLRYRKLSRMEEHVFVGRYEAHSKRLQLEDADAAPGAGRYDLKLDAAGDLDGKWSAKSAGPQGQLVLPIHVWRVGAP